SVSHALPEAISCSAMGFYVARQKSEVADSAGPESCLRKICSAGKVFAYARGHCEIYRVHPGARLESVPLSAPFSRQPECLRLVQHDRLPRNASCKAGT